MLCFFSSDLHGRLDRYGKLLDTIRAEEPAAVFLGGDLLPMTLDRSWVSDPLHVDFLTDYLVPEFEKLASDMGSRRPRVFLILGNDDPRYHESDVEAVARRGIWEYAHASSLDCNGYGVFGYAFVPPTPFQLKDWERYDVSRHVDPGCFSPESGQRTVSVPENEVRFGTIQKDLAGLTAGADLSRAIFLFHSPPYQTNLDRADLDGKFVEHVPLDVHVGSIAIQRFIEERQPLLTLHGHIHESTRLTGAWRDRIGATHCFQAAHDGPELSLIRFDPDDLGSAFRKLI